MPDNPTPIVTPAPAATPAAIPAVAAPAAAPAARTPSTPQVKKPTATAKPKQAGGVKLSRPPKSLSAKKAFGEDVAKESAAVTKRQRESYDAHNPATARYEAPVEVEAPVVAPAATPAPAPAAAAKPAEAAPAAPAETKVKVGGKEYTVAELEKRLAEDEQVPPMETHEPAAAQEPPQPTAEEMAQREAQFLEQTSSALDAPLTEAEMDKILGGGKEAIEALTNIRKRDMATAILHARKGIADGINPIVKDIFNVMKPLVQQQQAITRHNIKAQFAAKHADFVPHTSTCEQVADELIRLYPQQIAKMSQEQFIDEVARQSDKLLAKEHMRWFPDKGGNWRAGGLTPAAAAPAVAAATQSAPVLDPAAQAAPAAAPAPAVAPAAPAPSATLPGSQARMGKESWQKSVAMRLRS